MTVLQSSALRIHSIRDLRISRHMGQKELAKLAHVPINELRKCERGLTVPRRAFFESIGMILGMPGLKLMRLHENLSKNPKSGEGYVTHTGDNTLILPRKKTPKKHTKKILDLFCGIGGFSHGFEQTKKFEVIAGLDLLADRTRTFSENHKKAITYCDDITRFPMTQFNKDHISPNIIIGGPPCQGFSSIRPFRSINENDGRNNLFEYFAKTVEFLSPEWFVLENVVGLVTHRNGKTFSTLLSMFDSLGYAVSWKVLNAVHFGLPQRRERLIVVGNKHGKHFKFPAPTHYFNGRSMMGKKYRQNVGKNLKKAITVIDAIGDLPALESGDQNTKYKRGSKHTSYVRNMRKNSKKLTLHRSTAHSKRLVNIMKYAGPNIGKIQSSYCPSNPPEDIRVNIKFKSYSPQVFGEAFL